MNRNSAFASTVKGTWENIVLPLYYKCNEQESSGITNVIPCSLELPVSVKDTEVAVLP